MPFFITKSSGEKEEFNFKKLHHSLRAAGATERLITQITEEIKHIHPKSTEEIHNYAIARLAQENPPIAARYNLKRAIMELGPSGYSFELFVGHLLKKQNYTVEIDQEIQGACMHHEVDILAYNDSTRYMIECKFHNAPGLKTDVKVALYIRARFEDIEKVWQQEKNSSITHNQAWIFSNTQFTVDAIQYASCVGMRMTGWGYPIGESLAEMIDRYGLHPITALTSLNRRQKRFLIEQGLVLCKDIEKYRNELRQAGFSQSELEKIITESMTTCELEPNK